MKRCKTDESVRMRIDFRQNEIVDARHLMGVRRDGMDKMLQVFLDENISEYFWYKENGQWFDVLK